MAGDTAEPGAGVGDDGRLPVPPSDRRRARGLRTRKGIVDAAIDLIEAGNPRPTTRQVAVRAGVSARLVFHHFGRLGVVIRLAAERQAARHGAFVGFVPPHGPLPARIGAVCRQRRNLFEAIGPVLRMAHARAWDTPGLSEVLAGHRSLLRRQLEVTFGPELEARDGAAVLLDLLDHATGWPYWCALRFDAGHPASVAERAMVVAVTELLGRGGR